MKKTIFWAVTAKCGHVGGIRKYIPITFYVKAGSKKKASEFVISLPRVKHDNKYVILGIENITYDEYVEGQKRNAEDPYLKCKNPQEQRRFAESVSGRIMDEDDELCVKRAERIYKHRKRRKQVKVSLVKVRRLYESLGTEFLESDLCEV